MELPPAWHTSRPINMVFIVSIFSGNLILYRSPPILELICFNTLEALDKLNLLAFLVVMT